MDDLHRHHCEHGFRLRAPGADGRSAAAVLRRGRVEVERLRFCDGHCVHDGTCVPVCHWQQPKLCRSSPSAEGRAVSPSAASPSVPTHVGGPAIDGPCLLLIVLGTTCSHAAPARGDSHVRDRSRQCCGFLHRSSWTGQRKCGQSQDILWVTPADSSHPFHGHVWWHRLVGCRAVAAGGFFVLQHIVRCVRLSHCHRCSEHYHRSFCQ
mmetsp:Transcript_19743/g.52769  ORF Transcript_19743/g.52769 Transcript_19743/m.52769 type:complete len:208 (+) Transcript_19743:1132-1755(+)